MDSSFVFFIVCLTSACICGFIGYAIGESKGMSGLGAVAGGLLGPIGLIIVAILVANKPDVINEPEYYSPPPGTPRAVAYPSLDPPMAPRTVAAPKIAPPPRAPRFFISDMGGDVRGPFVGAEITRMREAGEIDDTTLFCIEGSQNWTQAPKAAS